MLATRHHFADRSRGFGRRHERFGDCAKILFGAKTGNQLRAELEQLDAVAAGTQSVEDFANGAGRILLHEGEREPR